MLSKLAVTLVALTLLFGMFSYVVADLSVGVKNGDWIEYNVSYTGSPSQGHNINWARMEVTGVNGPIISVTITSRFSDNSTMIQNSTLNFETGDLIDDFIIPANLKVGETFLDKNLGNVTIQRLEQHVYAGATRTVLYASTSTNMYVWDQATGVSVEGNAQEPDYTIHTIAADTNMWEPTIQSGGATDVFLVFILVVILAVISIAVAMRYRKRPH